MKLANSQVFTNVCIATNPAYTKSIFEEFKNRDPFGFISEIGDFAIRPIKYFFEPEELNKLAYIAYITWQYIYAILGHYSTDWPIHSVLGEKNVKNVYLLDDIANFLEQIDEVEQSRFVKAHVNALRKYSEKELEHFLFGNNFSDDECEMINDLFFMNRQWYMGNTDIHIRTDKKIADYLFNNLEFVLVDHESWDEWIKPYVNKIANYKERVESSTFHYSLFLTTGERVYREYYQEFERDLGDKSILVSKYLTSKGLRVIAQYSDGQQLIDFCSGEIITQDFNQFRSYNKKLWSLKEVPKWKLNDGLSPSLAFSI